MILDYGFGTMTATTFKLQYPMDPESSLYIMRAQRIKNISYPTGHSEKSNIILFHETCFKQA